MSDVFFLPLFRRLAKEYNAEIVVDEPSQGGYILFSDGHRSYFRRMAFGVNQLGSSRVVVDKTLTLLLLKDAGYTVPHGIQSTTIEILKSFAQNNDPPFVIKPNSSSQMNGISRINDISKINVAYENAILFSPVVRIEQEIQGQHMSVGIFSGEVVLAYRKAPFSPGEGIEDVTDLISENVKRHLGRAAASLNVHLASLDFVYTDSSTDIIDPKKCVIIEINSAPSFKKYGILGPVQISRVEQLYRKVLEKMIHEKL